MDRTHEQFLDQNYRFQRHVYDLTREYYLLGRNTLIKGLRPPDQGTVFEVGCGTARNLIRIAEHYPRASLYGIDLSRVMLATAERALVLRGLRGRISLAHADATSFEPRAVFDCARYDRILFSYTLSMIPDWRAALALAVTHLQPRGSVHIVDFGTGRDLPVAASTALRSWLDHFHVTPRDGLAAHLDQLATEFDAELSVAALYRSYTTYAVLTKR